jgi:hypothetical protein
VNTPQQAMCHSALCCAPVRERSSTTQPKG